MDLIQIDYVRLVVIFVSLLILDTLWLNGYLLKPFTSMITRVQKQPMQVRASGAVVAYLALYILAVLFLPRTDNYYEAFILGFCIYAVYDGTNYATLSDWELQFAIIDSLWGGTLFVLLKSILQLL